MKTKSLFIIAVLLAVNFTIAAQDKITYYDSLWRLSDKASAYRKVERSFDGTLYHFKTYDLRKNYLHSIKSYADTGNNQPVGYSIWYNENGTATDSSFYNDKSERLYGIHYYKNGKLKAEYRFDPVTKKEDVKGYNEDGTLISGPYIYEREAEFPGGMEGWKAHLFKHLNPRVPIKKKAPDGTYQVVVRFIVSPKGELTDMQAETSIGYGMEEEALRVLKKSPNWVPAVQFNQPVNAYRRQPIIFVVQ